MNLKCPAQLNQTIIIKTIEMKIQHLRGGQIANTSVTISDFVSKFQHHGKLFSEINVNRTKQRTKHCNIYWINDNVNFVKNSLNIKNSSQIKCSCNLDFRFHNVERTIGPLHSIEVLRALHKTHKETSSSTPHGNYEHLEIFWIC